MSEIIQIDETARIRVEYDETPTCPRGDWHMLTGFVKIRGRGDSRKMDVPAVWDEPIPIADAQSRIEREDDVVRWARIFHGLHVEYDSEHGGYWFVAGADYSSYSTPEPDPDLFRANWPDLKPGSADHLAKQAEVIESERATYQQWADGEVYGVIFERAVEWKTLDGSAMMTTWEEVDSVWGCYLDDEYTAEQVARENFGVGAKVSA